MRVTVDKDLCQAYGNCVLAAPDVFRLDASTPVAAILQPEPPETSASAVEEAVGNCPAEALMLHDS